MDVTCFVCQKTINIKSLREHFQITHKFEFHKSDCSGQFCCIEQECYCTDFSSFRNYERHVKKYHKKSIHNDDIARPRSIPSETEVLAEVNSHHNIDHDDQISAMMMINVDNFEPNVNTELYEEV